MRTTKCKVFSFDADEGIGLGILLNLNANQDERKKEGTRRKEGRKEGRTDGRTGRTERKQPQNFTVVYTTSRYVLVNTGVLDSALSDFLLPLRSSCSY